MTQNVNHKNFSDFECVEKEPFPMSQGAETALQDGDRMLRRVFAPPSKIAFFSIFPHLV